MLSPPLLHSDSDSYRTGENGDRLSALSAMWKKCEKEEAMENATVMLACQ